MNTTRLITAILGLCLGAAAIAQGTADDTGIPPQPLNKALEQFADQSGLQIIYVAELAEGKDTPGAKPNLSDTETLDQLLASTGLQYEFLNDNTVTVQAAADDAGGDSDLGNRPTAGATPRPVMIAQAAVEQSQTSRRTETDSDDDEKKRPLEEIIVTGTNIRGIAPESSPVRIFDREDILISGAATAQDFIQTLPQNFGGGSNADIPGALPDNRDSAFNSGSQGSLGSSVNLRGLGSGSTLVLLNGHRLAPSSGIGDFVDISMIPASAIERVEVLTDGASSIYGADAVAGVVNFVLRDDYEGVETSLRYGFVTEGNLDEYRASLTAGKSWDTGNALLSYEFFRQTNLSASDRAFSDNAVLPSDLLPSQRRHSVLASASQDLTPNFDIFADFVFSTREAMQDRTSLTGDIGRRSPSSNNLNISGGATWKVSDTWFVDFSGTYSDVHSEPNSSGDIIRSRELDSDIWTIDAKASGSVLRLPGGDLKLAVGGHYRAGRFKSFDVIDDELDLDSDRNVYALFSEAYIPIVGSENTVPGIERLEVNVSGRFEDYSDFGSTTNPKVGILWSPIDALNLRGSYSTSFVPPALGRVGADDFVASALKTSFIFDIFGITPADPSIADVVMITAFGTDKALDAESSRAFTAGFDFNEQWARHELALASTWFDIEFKDRLGSTPCPGCANTFDAPNIAFNNPELFPEGTIIFSPTQDVINDLVNSLDRLNIFPPDLNPLDAEIINFTSVVRNLAITTVRGLDFDVAYAYNSDFGVFTLGLDGTYLVGFEQQATAATPIVQQLNTQFNPVDLRLRGRAGFSSGGFSGNVFVNYTNDYFESNAENAPNIDSWTTMDVSFSYDTSNEPYDTSNELNNSILDNAIVRLSVLNLFNEEPPLTSGLPDFGIFGYDPANASPLGRFVAIELTKAF